MTHITETDIEIVRVSTDAEMADAWAIRRAVFMGEQGVSEAIELDGRDAGAAHYLLRRDGAPVGTARIRRLDDGTAKIERVAITLDVRGTGLGKVLMQRILDDLEADGAPGFVLHAQKDAEGFYLGLGFTTDGPGFEEAGIPHVKMVR